MSTHIDPIPTGAVIAANDAQISVRIPSLFLERLQQIAELEQRSVNNVVRIALYHWINEKAAQS